MAPVLQAHRWVRCRLLLLAAAATACASVGSRRFPDRAPLRREPERSFAPAPAATDEDAGRRLARQLLFDPADRWLALAPRLPARDVNSLDEVPDSSFWEGRAGARPLDPEEVRRGGEVGTGLADDGPLAVVRVKEAGITPGLVVEDARGARFVLKFDPVGYHGLLTGAEAAATRLAWALGYHVPDNRVVHLDSARFVVRDGDVDGREVARVLAVAARDPDGRVRALASRVLPGRSLGPMPWSGTRPDDPNDRVPHEDRRSLRALRVFYAWLNNPDGKADNSLDVFLPVGAGGEGVVRHYLLDFGDALGGGGSGSAEVGWWAFWAWRTDAEEGVVGAGRQAGLGAEARAVRRARERDPLVGGVAPEVDPWRFEFLVENPAFARLDDADAAWAARRLHALDERHLRAAVAAAEWPPEVADAVVRRLLWRRHAVLDAVWRRASPLGRPLVWRGFVCAPDLRPGRAPACARLPTRDGYHVVALRVAGSDGVMRVHVRRGDADARVVGVERE